MGKFRSLRNLVPIFLVIVISGCATLGFYPKTEKEFREGLALFNRGHYREAIVHFEKAIELDPEYGKAYLYLGRSHLNVKEWARAISPLRTAWRLSPEETNGQVVDILLDALLGAASSEFQKGNFQGSITYFKEALQLQPGSEEARKSLFRVLIAYGKALLSQGDASEAIRVFSEAIEIDPKDVGAHLGLARAFWGSGDLQNALQTTLKALKIDPANIALRLLLGELTK